MLHNSYVIFHETMSEIIFVVAHFQFILNEIFNCILRILEKYYINAIMVNGHGIFDGGSQQIVILIKNLLT